MMKKQYALYRTFEKLVRVLSFGKRVERLHTDLARTETASPDLEDFLTMLDDARREMSPADFGQCRVGHVDENGVGLYYDALAFLANEGKMDNYSEPKPLPEAAS